MRRQIGVGLLLALVTVFCLAGASEAVKFRYENLGTLGGAQDYAAFDYKEAAINDVGQVVGISHMAGGALHAFVKSPGQAMVDLGNIPGSTESHAPGINNSGVIGGTYLDNLGAHACKWLPLGGGIYQFRSLDYAGGSAVHGINDAGYLVGNARVSGFFHAYILPPGGNPQDLGMLSGHLSSFATGINRTNTIVGFSYDANAIPTACFWSPTGGSWTAAASLFGVADNKAHAVNQTGQAVGYQRVSAASHAILGSPGQPLLDLGTLIPGGESLAYDINDSGSVVGWASYDDGARAFLWTSTGGMRDLNNLVVNLPPGVILRQAQAINNRGEVAGYTTNGIFKLTPIVQPPHLLLLD